MLNGVYAVFKRELKSYFHTPLAYVFLVIFLFLASASTFYMGHFFERNQADLSSFFNFHPWLYLFLIPALAMRLWAEERKAGTIELLFTLPIPLSASVLGKYLAALTFTGIALMLTFPVWLTVNYLGQPDNGVILASYIGSLALAAGYLAISSAISACTRNQVVAFVVSVVVCLLFLLCGFPLAIEILRSWVPEALLSTISNFSFLTHFTTISQGIIDVRDIVYFISLIATALFINATILELKKAD